MSADPEFTLAPLEELAELDEQAVRDFWEHEVAISPELAERRLRELGLLAVAGADAGARTLAAVSTLYPSWVGRLRSEMWQMRVLVARRHRSSGLAARIIRETRARLEGEFASGTERRAPGLLLEIENPLVRAARSQGSWEPSEDALDRAPEGPPPVGTRYAFIGENELGHHLRVYWFEGALAPLPSAAPGGSGPRERPPG